MGRDMDGLTPAPNSTKRESCRTCIEVFAQMAVWFSLLFLFTCSWYMRRDLAKATETLNEIQLQCKWYGGFQAPLSRPRHRRSTQNKGPSPLPHLVGNELGRNGNATEVTEGDSSKEWPLEEVFSEAATTPRLQRKHHKTTRNGGFRASAEKFFTATEQTTSAPIMVRQSRTKPTHLNKNLWGGRRLQDRGIGATAIKYKQALARDTEAVVQDGGEDYAAEPVSAEADAGSAGCTPCQVLSAHFVSDTSNYSVYKHQHYEGNGRIKVSGVYKDWKPAHWTQQVGMTKHFHLHQGNVTVKEPGVYLIYAQIHYANVQEVNGYRVMRNNEVVSQCTATTSHPDRREVKADTCSLSTTVLLHAGDKVHLRDLHHERFVILKPEKSYFGLVLLSPLRDDPFGR